MSRYRSWPVRKADTEPFRSLDPMDRYLYWTVYLGPYSCALPGVSICGMQALAEACQLSDFDVRVASLQKRGVLLADPLARLFVLPDAIEDAAPQNPNTVKAWRTAFGELVDCDVKQELDRRVRAFLIRYGQANPAKKSKDDPAPSMFTWIQTWDPTFTEGSLNVAATFGEGSRNVPRTIREHCRPGSGSGAGSGSEPGPDPETEPGLGRGAGETCNGDEDEPPEARQVLAATKRGGPWASTGDLASRFQVPKRDDGVHGRSQPLAATTTGRVTNPGR